MAPTTKNVWLNLVAGIGYAFTFCACLVGTAGVLIALGIAIVIGRARRLVRQR